MNLLRSLLFTLPPETAHSLALNTLKFKKKIPSKPCKVMGLYFPNRVGLAAGMAKQMQQRLDELKAEYTEGLRMRNDWEAKLNNLNRTLLRINGAIQLQYL